LKVRLKGGREVALGWSRGVVRKRARKRVSRSIDSGRGEHAIKKKNACGRGGGGRTFHPKGVETCSKAVGKRGRNIPGF